ncbi:MAG: purine-nucleoside phosphorylase [Bryobacteraceae bacterium]
MIRAAAAELTRRVPEWPRIAIVLGSAQASFSAALSERTVIPYGEIPGWPVPRVAGHAGELIVGRSGSKRVALLSGRVHLYEGWTPQQVVFGVRVMGLLGVKVLLLTNAAGGISPSFRPGMQVFITDHINLQGTNPLCGPNDDSLGPRFPDMSEAYDRALLELARQTARDLGMQTGEGVYAAMLGPSFETPAEIRFLRTIGADLAGMSTVPEVIAARHMGMRVLAISTVTNMAAGMQQKLSHEEVLETGKASAAELKRFLEAFLERLEV